MKRKDFDLNEIFTYNNLYESYKSVCKSCRSKYKKTFFSFFLYSNLTDILNSLKDDTYNFSKYNILFKIFYFQTNTPLKPAHFFIL